MSYGEAAAKQLPALSSLMKQSVMIFPHVQPTDLSFYKLPLFSFPSSNGAVSANSMAAKPGG